MAGYLIANYNITNEEAYQQYLVTVGPTIVTHGVRYSLPVLAAKR